MIVMLTQVILSAAALLDKCVFYGMMITKIDDFDHLVNIGVIEVGTSQRQYHVMDGHSFNRLTIKDDKIGKFYASSKMIGQRKVDYCILETGIRGKPTGNLMCNSVDEYKDWLDEVAAHLINKYGIHVDLNHFDEIKIKVVEINKTFKLDGDFGDYHRAIKVIMSNLPKTLSAQVDWSKVNDRGYEVETYSAKPPKRKSKNFLELKIYNKTKSIQNIIVLNDDYMRVEITLTGSQKIKQSFGTNRLNDWNDDLINDYFDKQIEKLMIKPLQKWKKQRDKELIELMKQQRKNDIRHWQTNVLRIVASQEIDKKCPIILDVNEMINVLSKLGISSKRISEIGNNMRHQAQKYEPMFCRNDDVKLQEIVLKVTAKEAVDVRNKTEIAGIAKTA